MDEAFITLVTNNVYAIGAIVLGHSLRKVNTTKRLVVLITDEVDPLWRLHLGKVYDNIEIVTPIECLLSNQNQSSDLQYTLCKIHAWKLTQYTRCVFLDADTLVLENVDDLFALPEISASPSLLWPDNFDPGVFVLEPSRKTHKALQTLCETQPSYDNRDHGILNDYFRQSWTSTTKKRISFLYNFRMNITSQFVRLVQEQHLPLIKIVHFQGTPKPWHIQYAVDRRQFATSYNELRHFATHLRKWFQIYHDHIQSQVATLDSIPLVIRSILPTSTDPKHNKKAKKVANYHGDDFLRCYTGNADYRDKDGYHNIEQLINYKLDKISQLYAPPIPSEFHLRSIELWDSTDTSPILTTEDDSTMRHIITKPIETVIASTGFALKTLKQLLFAEDSEDSSLSETPVLRHNQRRTHPSPKTHTLLLRRNIQQQTIRRIDKPLTGSVEQLSNLSNALTTTRGISRTFDTTCFNTLTPTQSIDLLLIPTKSTHKIPLHTRAVRRAEVNEKHQEHGDVGNDFVNESLAVLEAMNNVFLDELNQTFESKQILENKPNTNK